MHEDQDPIAETPSLALAALTIWAYASGHVLRDHEQLGIYADVTDDVLFEERDLPLGCTIVGTRLHTLVVLDDNIATQARPLTDALVA